MSSQTPPNEIDETIGIADDLTPYIKRINAAVGYAGTNDHEDVRSILKELLTARELKLLIMWQADLAYACGFTKDQPYLANQLKVVNERIAELRDK